MTPNILIIHPRDNVGVVLSAIGTGERAVAQGTEGLTAVSDIPPGHKIALEDIAAGQQIIKYGEPVAVSTRAIKKGEWVHTHNLESKRWKR